MSDEAPIRWGIRGTANIARAAFLPGLRAAGGGVAAVVGSRDPAHAREWAAQHGVERAAESYDAVLDDETVQAVYIPLPNHLHARWAAAALRAGKAVLCEKPLCISVEETQALLDVARETGGLLWEAFVFPFHRQIERMKEVLAAGTIGAVREIQSNYYFKLRSRQNIRLSVEAAGGALNDVGCYPLRLAEMVFGRAADTAVALPVWAPEGVDEEMSGLAGFGDKRRLAFSCGVLHPYDTFTRLIGTDGEIRFVNPYHPVPTDTLEVRLAERETIERLVGQVPSFAPAIAHIHAVMHGREEPRHLALEDSAVTARDLALVRAAMETHRQAPPGAGEVLAPANR